MILHNQSGNKFPYYTFQNLNLPRVKHFVTSGLGREKTDINLRLPMGADNRRWLAQTIGFQIEKLTTAEQKHTTNVAVVDESNAGSGSTNIETRIPNTDALITNQPGICLMALSADCVPILLYDKQNHAAAAIHSGWRGTAQGIVKTTVEAMQQQFGTNPNNLVAGIGPCISVCCFEVGNEVAEQFAYIPNVIEHRQGAPRPFVDLVKANRYWLTQAGVLATNIEESGLCTSCQHNILYSHRRNPETIWRHGAGIVLE